MAGTDLATRTRRRIPSAGLAILIFASFVVRFGLGVLPTYVTCARTHSIVGRAPTPLTDASSAAGGIQGSFLSILGDGWFSNREGSLDLDVASRGHGGPRHDAAFHRSLVEHHFVRGWERDWSLSGSAQTFAEEEAFEFRTEDDAQAFQRWATNYSCHHTTDAFSVPGRPGAVGFRLHYRASRQVNEQVTFVAGSRRYLIVVSHKTLVATDRTLILKLAGEAIDAVSASTSTLSGG